MRRPAGHRPAAVRRFPAPAGRRPGPPPVSGELGVDPRRAQAGLARRAGAAVPPRPRGLAGESDSPAIMRVPEVVALLGVDRKTIYEAVARDEIPHRRVGAGRGSGRGGVILFLRSAIMRWLSGVDEYPQRKVAMFGNYVTKRAKELGIPVVEARIPVRLTVTSRDVASATKKSSKQCALARASVRLPDVRAGYFFRTTAYLEYRDKMVRYALPTSVQKEIVSFDRARMFAPGAYQLSPTSTPTRQERSLTKDKAKDSQGYQRQGAGREASSCTQACGGPPHAERPSGRGASMRMTGMISNPGAGPVGGDASYADACSNVEAFVSDLSLSDPRVRVRKPGPARADGGRFLFVLRRGIREASVDMPGISLARVRYVDGADAWRFPRLYVDGSSWLWEFAVDVARLALRDPDGFVERRVEASRLQCEEALARSPRCPVCQTLLLAEQTRTSNGDGDYRVLCLGCTPCVEELRQNRDGAVYRDDSWRTETHYLVRRQRLAPEVPGHDCGSPPGRAVRGRDLPQLLRPWPLHPEAPSRWTV